MNADKYQIKIRRLSNGRILFTVKRPGEPFIIAVMQTLSEAMDAATDDAINMEMVHWRVRRARERRLKVMEG